MSVYSEKMVEIFEMSKRYFTIEGAILQTEATLSALAQSHQKMKEDLEKAKKELYACMEEVPEGMEVMNAMDKMH